jgi:hypothetical protein
VAAFNFFTLIVPAKAIDAMVRFGQWCPIGEWTMPDGTPAAEIDGNRVTMRLIEGMLAKPGMVWMALVLRCANFTRLSAFPVMMTVTKGLEDVGKLPKQYYLVRNLEEINTVIREIRELV